MMLLLHRRKEAKGLIDQAGIMMAQGKNIACERIQGVNDNMAKSHYHEYFELYYLETGERFHTIDGTIYKNSPGEFFIFPPYVMHHSYGEADIPFKRLLVYFRPEEVAGRELLRMLETGTGVYKPDARGRQTVHRMLEEMLAEQDNPSIFSVDYSRTLLNMTLFTVARAINPPLKIEKTGRISDIIQYIHNHYSEDINLEKLAQIFYISPYYLCREFKRCTNSTMVQYLNVTRIMNAQRKFMETDMNITEISKATGFSNVTHFNRVFKTVAGMPPSRYRKEQVGRSNN